MRGAVVVRRMGLLGSAGVGTCPNLLQRRSAARSAARRSAEYQRFSSRTPMGSRPLQQIRTTGATADLSGAAGVAPPDRKVIRRAVMRVRGGGARDRQRAHGGALLLGPLAFRWTTCVRLDHLCSVGPPGSRNRVVQRHSSGPTARKWSKQTEGVTTCETPSHQTRRPTGSGHRNRPAVTQSVPDDADTQSSPDDQPRPGPRARHLTPMPFG